MQLNCHENAAVRQYLAASGFSALRDARERWTLAERRKDATASRASTACHTRKVADCSQPALVRGAVPAAASVGAGG